MTDRAASHVLMIEPVGFRHNEETGESNPFQVTSPSSDGESARTAIEQHRALRNLLITNGVRVTAVRGEAGAPDGTFCNNWFSTHRPRPATSHAGAPRAAALVLYPMLAPNRRIERREDLIGWLRAMYPHVIDFSAEEAKGRFLESTGSLCLDDRRGVAYAAISSRTDRSLTEEWAAKLGYELVAVHARDDEGRLYYHTNVMMFMGHDVAVVCAESVDDPGERARLEASLRESVEHVVFITRAQVNLFCGNTLALGNDAGERLFVMSTTAYRGFTSDQRAVIERGGRIIHTDLSVFEAVGGGSCRCLLGELV